MTDADGYYLGKAMADLAVKEAQDKKRRDDLGVITYDEMHERLVRKYGWHWAYEHVDSQWRKYVDSFREGANDE